jgi:FkbM family methyltransferase
MPISFDDRDLFRTYPFQLHPNATFIDVGANVGSYTEIFARLGWHSVAFEPVPELFAQMKVRTQGLPNITYIDRAVSEVTGETVDFYTSAVHQGIHALKPFHPTHEATLKVETIRIDDALRPLSLPPIALLKIDVEGADFIALKSFDFTQHHPEIVTCEFMDSRTVSNYGYNYHDMVRYMEERGYVTFVSEWTPITQYGTATQHNPTRFIRCVRYTSSSEPAWGNLIFVTADRVSVFENHLKNYLQRLQQEDRVKQIRGFVKRIPGLRHLKNILRPPKPKTITVYQDFEPYIKEVSLKSLSFRFFYGTSQAREWYDPIKPYAALEYDWVIANVPLQNQKIIDAGGHHGQYSVVFALAAQQTADIVVVDPMDSNCALIEVNMKLNHADCRIEMCAVSTSNEPVHFLAQSNGRIVDAGGVVKPAKRLVDIMADATVVKLDIEGAEFAVLPEALQSMTKVHSWILELHPGIDRNPDTLAQLLAQKGFTLHWVNYQTLVVEPYILGSVWPRHGTLFAQQAMR